MTIATLTTQEQAEALITGPTAGWILKHSNTCPVSSAAYDEVEGFCASQAQPLPAGMVVVQQARPLSNWLATRLGFVHQSPQLFLVRSGTVLWQASHWGITQKAMTEAVQRTASVK